jgi:methionyl-tRNA formyltransferase
MSAIKVIEGGNVKRYKQDDSKSTYAAKIEKADCMVDFSKRAEDLHNQIRGTSPFPLSFAYLNGKMLKINRARPIAGKGNPGEVISLNSQGEGEIVIACGEGALSVTRVIPEGKGKMTAGDFIRGRKISLGDILTYEP